MTAPGHLGHSAQVDRSNLDLCVDVLGPLTLRVEGEHVDVPGARRRALLALLALEGNRGASTARLVDSLWPDETPENGVQALYNLVSRLRRHLGPLAGRLEKQANGYRLRLQPYELDVDAARRTADSDPAAALGLWRAPALVEFRSVPALEIATVGLDELQLKLTDDVLERRLRRGERDVAVDAHVASAAAPLRERTALLLVRALAVEGRHAEAMNAAQAFRRRLADEAGLDPSAALAELEQQVAAGSVPASSVGRRVAPPDSPMLGRQHDREEVVRLQRTHGVVTITGPGGVGKTRLALDVASDAHPREVVVVRLAVVDRAEHVHVTVASHLGLRLAGGTGAAQIAQALADRTLLLVLDNCEHVLESCRELVTALRRAAPGVQVLATSRATLQVPGEHVVRLRTLPVPRDGADLASLRRHASVRAFVEHARRLRPEFELTPEDAPDLIDVLRRLDGLPLAIELAARQVAVMPVRAVRERLDRALDLSTGRTGVEDVRQRTLRSSIDSSYRLLSGEAQRLLRAIAPFVGGVDLATVEDLAGQLDGDPLDLLHLLVDSSLLDADAGRGRYGLLFTVRAFLVDEATRLGEVADADARFVERSRVIAEEIAASMFGPAEAATDRRLREEVHNLRRARDLAPEDTRVSLTMAVSRVVTWRDLRELWEWSVELAEDPALAHHAQRAAILAGAADAARLVGDFDAARQRAEQAMATADPVSERTAVSRAASVLAVVAHFRGDFSSARATWLDAADGAGVEASAYVGSAALAAAYEGDPAAAYRLLDRARSLATCGSHRAFAAYVEGELCATSEPAGAVPHYVVAIEEAEQVGCSFVEGVARVSLASTRARIGDVSGAAEGFDHLIGSWRRTGQSTQLWTTARNAAELLRLAGRTRVAALLLTCADAVPGAASVDARIARFSGRSFTRVQTLVDAEELEEIRAQVDLLGPSGVLDVAQAELRTLV